jgi:excisionase family DNA binding protein
MNTHEIDNRYISTDVAAKYCGVSARWLEKLRVVGGGPRYAKVGRRVLYRRQDLDAWITAGARGSTSELAQVAA